MFDATENSRQYHFQEGIPEQMGTYGHKCHNLSTLLRVQTCANHSQTGFRAVKLQVASPAIWSTVCYALDGGCTLLILFLKGFKVAGFLSFWSPPSGDCLPWKVAALSLEFRFGLCTCAKPRCNLLFPINGAAWNSCRQSLVELRQEV